MRAPRRMRPASGSSSADDQLEQRRLARAVRTDEADLVATEYARRKRTNHRSPVVTLRHVMQLDDQLTRSLARRDGEIHLAEAFTARCTLAPQRFEPPHAPFVARPARFDPLAYPRLLLREKLVEACVPDRLRVELLLFAPLILREGAGVARELSAVELDHARRHVLQEPPVVRHEEERGAEADEQRFEPLDRRDVEVVRRLVEKQQLRDRARAHVPAPRAFAIRPRALRRAHRPAARNGRSASRRAN